MTDHEIFIQATETDASALEAFCSQQGIRTERFESAVNSTEVVATALTGLIIIAKYDLVSKCIVAFRGTRRASVEYFIPGGGWKKIDAPTVEDLIKIFRETDRIVLVPSAETAPQEQPKKEMGFHAKN